MTEKTKLIAIADLSDLLGLSISRLRYEVFHQRIPFLKVGRSIRFNLKEIEKWLETKKVEAKNNEKR